MTAEDQEKAEIETIAKYIAEGRPFDWKMYLRQCGDAYAEVIKLRRRNGFVLVPESAISPVRGPGADK